MALILHFYPVSVLSFVKQNVLLFVILLYDMLMVMWRKTETSSGGRALTQPILWLFFSPSITSAPQFVYQKL